MLAPAHVLPSPLAGCCLAPCVIAMRASSVVGSGSGSYSPSMDDNAGTWLSSSFEPACLVRSLANGCVGEVL